MSIDQVLRAVGTVACLYMVGLSVSAITMASIGAVSFASASPCNGHDCGRAVIAQHHAAPEPVYSSMFAAPMILFATVD